MTLYDVKDSISYLAISWCWEGCGGHVTDVGMWIRQLRVDDFLLVKRAEKTLLLFIVVHCTVLPEAF
jgi:hypothetical protein